MIINNVIHKNSNKRGAALFVLVFSLTTLNFNSFGQSISCDDLTPLSKAVALLNALQRGECLEEISDIDSAEKLIQLLDLDVIKYYDLGSLYDTDQKLNDYKQTKDYKDRLESLTEMKSDKMKEIYYSVLTTQLGDYSWAVKGFKFNMDNLDTRGGLAGMPPPPQTMFYSVELGSIPFQVEYKVNQSITLPVIPDSGMTIMRNRDSVMTIVLFKLAGVFPKEYSYYNAQCSCNRNAKEEVIKTKFDRVIIFNNRSNAVFYDEVFDKASVK